MKILKGKVVFSQASVYMGLILLVAAGLRVWSLNFGLPYRYHIDEPAYVVSSLEIAQGDLHPKYPPQSPSLQELIYIALFGLLFLTRFIRGDIHSTQEFSHSYQLDPSAFYLLARSVSVLASLAAIVVLFILVRRLRDQTTALLASLFLAVCFLDVRHAHFVEPYSLLALLALCSVYSAQIYIDTGKHKWLIISGLITGLAIGIRISMVSLVLVPLYAAASRWYSLEESRKQISLLKNLSILALAGISGLLLGVPGLVVNFNNTIDSIRGQSALASGANGFLGLVFSELPTWQFYLVLLGIAWGIPLLIAILLGLIRQVIGHRQQDLLFAIFPATFAIVLLSASAESSAFARYLIPILPFLAYLAADGVCWVYSSVSQKYSLTIWQVVFLGGVILLILIPLLNSLRLDYLWSKVDTRTQAKQWIEDHIPGESKIRSQWYGPPLSSQEDPEPESEKLYQLQVLYPFSMAPGFYNLDNYREKGFQYLILSSFIYQLKMADPAAETRRLDFYQRVESETELLAEFKPACSSKEPPFLFEQMWGPITSLFDLCQPGPTIKIYRIQ